MFTVFRVDLYLFHALILEFIQRGLGVRGEKLLYGVILSVAQLADIASKPETGLFIVMGQYPLGMILCVVSLILLCTFFITSANSGTFVLAMFSSKGDLNPKNGRKVLWGVVQSLLAVGLLVAGGLKPLQTISLAAAFPFIFIMLFAGAALVKALMKEK